MPAAFFADAGFPLRRLNFCPPLSLGSITVSAG
jgi:hypothetical protein